VALDPVRVADPVQLPKVWVSVVNLTAAPVKDLLLGARDDRKVPAHLDESSPSVLLLLPRRTFNGVLACALMPPRRKKRPKLLPLRLHLPPPPPDVLA
jgi:hypothetical protein